jgi:hypothetical protein
MSRAAAGDEGSGDSDVGAFSLDGRLDVYRQLQRVRGDRGQD